ncbi:4-hydroxy-2-oxoheptanedioate aldolase [Sphingobium faniae]|nr:4-hydroxy-2-oxoheptanedioate aldolase [Sphingobium faniae]
MDGTAGQNALRRIARNGNARPLGLFIASIDPATTEIAADAGFDFAMIDAEHAPQDRLTVLGHVRAAEARGIVPLARILDSSNHMIQSMLDVGVKGVVVPKVESGAEAERIVAATRYAPAGKRGMCPACHDGRYTVVDFKNRMARRNSEVLAIPIIETVKGVENIEEIVAVDGMDIIHFGPGDLSADMGIDLNTELDKLQDAWVRVRDASHAAGKAVLVPSGMGFEGGDALSLPMELMILHSTLTSMVGDMRKI